MKTTLTDSLTAKLFSSFEKHEVRGVDQKKIIEWSEGVITGANILANVERGMMEVVGINEKEEPLFQLSDSGAARAKQIMGDNQ